MLSIGGRRMVSATAWWDPAYGSPGAGDASVVAAVFVDAEGAYWLHGIRYLSHDPAQLQETDEATQLCRQVAAFAAEMRLPAIVIETNGLGRFLPALLRRELGAAGVACAVVERFSHASKEQRILDAFDPLLAAGALHAHASVWSTPFIEEMREWRPARRCRDDGLDAVSGCLLAEPVRLRRFAPGPRREWRPGSLARVAAGRVRAMTLHPLAAAPRAAPAGRPLSCGRMHVNEPWTISWVWWISAVELPVVGCLFWLIHHGRRESERALLRVYREIQGNLSIVLDNLAQSKLEVARLYATIADLKDVEKRLTDHLVRVETRLNLLLEGDARVLSHWPRGMAERARRLADRGASDAA